MIKSRKIYIADIIAKGEVYERNLFTTKEVRFKNEGFLDEVKRSYTDLINLYVKDDKQKQVLLKRELRQWQGRKKETDQMKRVGLMNNLKVGGEEIVIHELMYAKY